MPFLLPFGLKGGELVHIDAVPSGLACGCRCPGCGARLIARKGVRKAHHFSHEGGASCDHALESALHRFAKSSFEENRSCQLPPVKLLQHPAAVFGARRLTFERVFLEKRLPGLRPDLIVETPGRPLLIEISVTHPAGLEKIRRLYKLQLPAIEIDLGGWLQELEETGRPLTPGALHHVLHQSVKYKHWLFHPQKNVLEARIRQVASVKKVRRRRYRSRFFHQVAPCPIAAQSYQPTFGEPQSFAEVFQNCLQCSYCLEIQYHKEMRGFREVVTRPETVICWGKWRGKEEELIDALLALIPK